MANLITPRARLSFPALFEKRAGPDGGEAKFSCTLLFDESAQRTSEFAALKAAVLAAAKEKWGDKLPSGMRNPLRSGNDKAHLEGYEGSILINCRSKMRPQIVDVALREITDETLIYPGCYVRASVQPYAYDAKGNRGVAFGLRNVQKLADGEPMGGRTRATDDFTAVGEDAAASDSDFDKMFN